MGVFTNEAQRKDHRLQDYDFFLIDGSPMKTLVDSPRYEAIIIGTRAHWYTLKKKNGKWWNINSSSGTNPRMTVAQVKDLVMEQRNVFAIRELTRAEEEAVSRDRALLAARGGGG